MFYVTIVKNRKNKVLTVTLMIQSKLRCEKILNDVWISHKAFNVANISKIVRRHAMPRIDFILTFIAIGDVKLHAFLNLILSLRFPKSFVRNAKVRSKMFKLRIKMLL